MSEHAAATRNRPAFVILTDMDVALDRMAASREER